MWAFFALIFIVFPTAAVAEGAIAHGIQANGGFRQFLTWNHQTQQLAVDDALKACRNARLRNCHITNTFNNSCVHEIYMASVNSTGFATDAELNTALNSCAAHGHVCQPTRKICDTISEQSFKQAEMEAARHAEEDRQRWLRQAEQQEEERTREAKRREEQQAHDSLLQAERRRAAEAEAQLKELRERQTISGFLDHYIAPLPQALYDAATASPARVAAVSTGLTATFFSLLFFVYHRQQKRPADPKGPEPQAEKPKRPIEPTLPEPHQASQPSPIAAMVSSVASILPERAQTFEGTDRRVRIQASISHHQERANFYVTLKLLFSPEALVLIQARALQNTEIIKGFDHPPMNTTSVHGLVWFVRLMRGFAPMLVVGSFIWGLAGGGTAAGFLLFLTIGLTLWTYFGPDKIFKDRIEKSFTIGYFLRNPTLKLWAPDPTTAKELDETIRERLQLLKLYLEDSKTLPESETFDV